MTVYNLFATVWKVPSVETVNLKPEQKAMKFRQALESAHGFMQSTADRLKLENPVFVFVAPEYYWIKTSLYALYSKTEQEEIYQAIQQASAKSAGTIVFPGTVNWQVPRAEHVGTPTKGGKRNFVAYNVCPVYLGGNILLEYFKKFNDNQIDGTREGTANFAPGPSDGRQHFSAKNLQFGLDICGDNREGKLSLTLGVEQKMDVMVLTSGTVPHDFADQALIKVPVRDGGAFIHCDSSGSADRNGMWVLDRGQGWHGVAKREVELEFFDLDNIKRRIGFPADSAEVPGMTMKVTAIAGFGKFATLDAKVLDKSPRAIRKFTTVIPGIKSQTLLVERTEKTVTSYKLTLSRSSNTKLVEMPPLKEDHSTGMDVTGRGNVNKIGRLPNPSTDWTCYTTPIVKH